MIKQEEIDKIHYRQDAFEKRQALFIKKDEFMVRINNFQSEFKEQLAVRPVEKQIRQLFKHLDDKFNQQGNEINKRIDLITNL